MSVRNAVIWFLRNDICKGVERLNNRKSIGEKKCLGRQTNIDRMSAGSPLWQNWTFW